MHALESRQRWMSVLAHSRPEQLRSHWLALNLSPGYRSIRAPEIGLAQLQGRMGATGRRFVLGDMTVTRAVVQLDNGGYGYSYIAGRDKAHAELCALADALLQQPEHGERLQQQLIAPLAALQHEQRQLRARAIAASRVDFFTLVRGD
ncbi:MULTISPECIES: phosphonate C-P lyase system protein PhnG [Serratia]|uniref:Alpha-D-ribose 1-methylphosphonate 5-triphosphate synthase subunit PhnG n=1 Tax=Serratia nematodiphila TaxID=458197 RepID=A0A1G5DWK5_9GAMM|nr:MULTISPECIES: phosphonate C-P lyase system protein PhnG [Serratia]ALL36298.1 phosphonate C-P lyase system protein PhnG [Serratia marcescens]ANM80711.1 phosphonate C-P lyase system protein PhnG [Serratia marcescens]KFF87146.1 phosphonate C-P lyase [Serratia nematodiphila DZ0503SBS1]MBH3203290.1 phosphonate C-P lyase system protein PhnG [Serratia marcescens]MDV5741651.1 phosphonate C-P lyase system protein PhnG [Serratia marcescens]